MTTMRSSKLLLRVAALSIGDSTSALRHASTTCATQFTSLASFHPKSPISAAHPSAATFSQFRRCSYSTAAPQQPARDPQDWTKHVLYRGKGIKIFRMLVRFKVFQLAGVAAVVPITTAVVQGTSVPLFQAVLATALLVGSGAASTALWYYSRRYVGELALLIPPGMKPDIAALLACQQGTQPGAAAAPKARFSVLDFWANREDVDVNLSDVVPPLGGLPPASATVLASEPFLPVTVAGDRQYIMSLRYGEVVDGKLLRVLLEGRMEGGDTAAADGRE